MSAHQLQRNIRWYGFFQALREPLFWGPIVIYYIQHVSGMALADVYAMEAVVVLLVVVMQVPTGALADVIGRKKTVLIGSLLLVADGCLFGLASSPLLIWLANVVWAIGFCLTSGADSSLLYDLLAEAGQAHRYKQVQGRTTAYRFVLIAFSSIAAGYLLNLNIRFPIWLSMPGVVAACVFLCLIKEPPRAEVSNGVKESWNLMKLSVLFVANNRRVKWIIAYVVLLGVVGKVWFFTYNPYFELVKLPLQYYGWIFFGLNLVAAIFSFGADWLSRKLSNWFSIVLMLALTGVPIILMSLVVVAPMALLTLLQNGVRGYLKPFSEHFMHDQLDSANRATVMSVLGAVDGLAQFFLLGLFGLLLKGLPLTRGLLVLGLATVVIGLYLLLQYRKIFKPKPR